MIELLRLALVLVFVALGVRIRRAVEGPPRRRAVKVFLAYVLAVEGAVGALQWDAWPFTSHTIAVGRARADSRMCRTELYGLDDRGREWPLDPYTFTPVFDSILQYWLEQSLDRLSPEGRERVLAFLLERAEASRVRLAAGGRIGPERLLGAFGAPYWLLLPRHSDVPAAPWRGLRAYSSCWLPAERLAGAAVDRRLLAEHRR
jgi:hypothetical protein